MNRFIPFYGLIALSILLMTPLRVTSIQSHQPLIIDNAKILSPEEYESLNFILNGYYNAKTVEFVFFSTKSLGGKTVDAYSQQIISNFGIGRHGINNGLLFFVAI